MANLLVPIVIFLYHYTLLLRRHYQLLAFVFSVPGRLESDLRGKAMQWEFPPDQRCGGRAFIGNESGDEGRAWGALVLGVSGSLIERKGVSCMG